MCNQECKITNCTYRKKYPDTDSMMECVITGYNCMYIQGQQCNLCEEIGECNNM